MSKQSMRTLIFTEGGSVRVPDYPQPQPRDTSVSFILECKHTLTSGIGDSFPSKPISMAVPDANLMQQYLQTVLQSDEFSQLLNAHIDTRVNHITAEAAVAAEAQIQTLNVRVSDLITLFSQSQNDRSSKPATAPLSKFSGKAADLWPARGVVHPHRRTGDARAQKIGQSGLCAFCQRVPQFRRY